MRRVMYNVNGTLTPSYKDALASGNVQVVLEKIEEPKHFFIPKGGLKRLKAVKPKD